MIQRIQTLLLIVIVLLTSLLIFMPLASFTNSETSFLLKADSLMDLSAGADAVIVVWPLFILLMVMVVVPFVTIFLYKKRILQSRIVIFNAILNVLFYIMYFYECSTIATQLQGTVSYKIPVLIIPVAVILLSVVAFRRIWQDEMLIRSLNSNRIR